YDTQIPKTNDISLLINYYVYPPLYHLLLPPPPTSTLFPYTTLFRSAGHGANETPHVKERARVSLHRIKISTARDLRRDRHDVGRSEEHTSELQSSYDLVCRLLLEKKKEQYKNTIHAKYRNYHKTHLI